MSHYFTYPATCLNVVDGDTFDLLIDEGMDGFRKVRVRLADVDTAEIYGTAKDSEEYQKGMEQKRFVEDFVEPDTVIDFSEDFEERFDLSVRTTGKGKYGRYVCRVWRDEDSLNEALIEEWPEVEDS